MKKIMALTISCILTPVFAAPSLVPGLAPRINQIQPPKLYTETLKNNAALDPVIVKAGGYGGNVRIGKLIYSGTPNTLPALNVSRDSNSGICFLKNQNVIINSDNRHPQMLSFSCDHPNPDHANLYWNADFGTVNGGYSPANDILYATDVVSKMFSEWYGIPPSKDANGLPKPINIFMERYLDNASMYPPDESIYIGEGEYTNYPATSLAIIGYMIGLLFTQQNSHLHFPNAQSGSINIAFACMSAMAIEFYVTGKNTWQIGAEINQKGQAVRYLDVPSKNCHRKKPGDGCDIDTLSQYNDNMEDVQYYSSGLFNRAFYLLATSSGWDTHKAYDVFVYANRFYWQSSTDFKSGACDAVKSARTIGYDTQAVSNAFSGVGIDTRDC